MKRLLTVLALVLLSLSGANAAVTSSVVTVAIKGSVPSEGGDKLSIDIQVTKATHPTLSAPLFIGSFTISGKEEGKHVLIALVKFLDVTAKPAPGRTDIAGTGFATVTASYVLKNIPYQIEVERSVPSPGKWQVRYWITRANGDGTRKVVSMNYCPNEKREAVCAAPLTGTPQGNVVISR